MTEPPTITVETIEALYGLLKPKERELVAAELHQLTSWLMAMNDFTNPNACACRKGAKVREALTLVMFRFPDILTNEHKGKIRNIMGTGISLLIEGQKTAMLA